MKNPVSAMYIIFGLLIVTLTYFNNFVGPVILRGFGWVLLVVGTLNMFSTYFSSIQNPLTDLFNTEEEKNE
ncbi:hypothetical protein ACFVRR_22635 [Gottfriedia sp. NPDC057948]|uniref:hypothetical protein n=1 Tax=Gottfriedia sp. NPDC057948 TaxID=3346287 RepID=UPI0036DC7659